MIESDKSEAWKTGFHWAWDSPSAHYERSSNPYEPNTDQWKDFYKGWVAGMKDVDEHRRRLGNA